jgi:peptide/nickel transport system substrate-binding protein
MVKSYQPSVAVIYVKNPDYFIKGLPYIDEVHYIVSPDASTNLAALRAGQIDVGGVGFENYASVKASNPELTFIEYPAGYMNYIHMRCDVPPFNDVRVRQAVGMAIDWQGWIEARYWGKGHVQGPVPLFLEEFYLPPEKLGEGGKYQVYNPTEAKRLLAEAGYPNGFDTIMNFTAGYSAAWVEDCELMIDYLNKVGIRAKINLKEYAAHIATTTWGKYDGMAYCPSTGFYDVDSYLYGRFHSSLEKNISRVNDPVLDALLEKTRKAIGHKEYVQAIQDAAKYLAVQSYSYIQPAWTGIAAVQPWVHDYEPKSVSYDPGGRFMRVWLDSRSPTRK